jgi:4-alpha-glucanotransferase
LKSQLQALRQTDLVDYVPVAEIKLAALRELWQSWRDAASGCSDLQDFEGFIEVGGDVLRRHALFEALSASTGKSSNGTGWKYWPVEHRIPRQC